MVATALRFFHSSDVDSSLPVDVARFDEFGTIVELANHLAARGK